MSDSDLPNAQRIKRISSLTDVLRALNRVHREVRLKQMSMNEMKGYVSLYRAFSDLIKDQTLDDLDERLQALEDKR